MGVLKLIVESQANKGLTTVIGMASPPRPPLHLPTEVEARNYYWGLPGTPMLVARLGFQSDNPDISSVGGYVVEHRKQLTTIGQHRLKDEIDQTEGNRLTLRSEILHSISSLPWVSVDYVRTGWVREDYSRTELDINDAKPTIFIMVKAGATDLRHAQTALEQVWDACARRGIFDVEVEIVEGVSSGLNNKDPDTNLDSTYQAHPLCGASLGALDDEKSVGTLGCYVTINGEHAGRYILTNDHVVFPDDRTRPQPANQPFNYTAATEHPYFVASPATRTHNDISECLHYEINRARATLHNLELKLGLVEDDNIPTSNESYHARLLQRETLNESDYQRLARQETLIQDRRQAFETRQKFNRKVGRVCFSSGNRKSSRDDSRLDWALVALDADRIQASVKNNFPPFDFSDEDIYHMDGKIDESQVKAIGGRQPERRYIFDKLTIKPLSGIRSREDIRRAINGTYDASQLKVIKFGQKTQWTHGVINEIKADCTRDGDTLITKEVTVVNRAAKNFADCGDSGSIVLDFHGNAMGLVHTCSKKEHTWEAITTRISPMDTLFADIKEVTGATEIRFE